MTRPLLEPILCTGAPRLRLPAEPLGPGVALLHTERAPTREDENEDAALLLALDERRAVLAVADGVGGLPSAAQAARATLAAVADAVVAAAQTEGALREAILDGFDAANRAVLGLGVGAGSTLVVAEIRGRVVRSYHVGDSTVLLVGGRGRVKLRTLDHSPVGYAVEAGLLDAQEAMDHEDRHLISNVVGTANMRIEMGPLTELSARDTLVLGSDGLFDNLHAAEIIDRVRKGPLDAAADALVALARQRMRAPAAGDPCKPDDLTFMLYRPGASR